MIRLIWDPRAFEVDLSLIGLSKPHLRHLNVGLVLPGMLWVCNDGGSACEACENDDGDGDGESDDDYDDDGDGDDDDDDDDDGDDDGDDDDDDDAP